MLSDLPEAVLEKVVFACEAESGALVGMTCRAARAAARRSEAVARRARAVRARAAVERAAEAFDGVLYAVVVTAQASELVLVLEGMIERWERAVEMAGSEAGAEVRVEAVGGSVVSRRVVAQRARHALRA